MPHDGYYYYCYYYYYYHYYYYYYYYYYHYYYSFSSSLERLLRPQAIKTQAVPMSLGGDRG